VGGAFFASAAGVGDLDIFGFGPGGWGVALLEGAVMTLLVSACGLLIGAAIGSLVAWARLSRHRIAGAVGEAYAALFRGLPELLVVYFVYFGSSTLLTESVHLVGYEGFLGVPSFVAGALAVGVISGSYQAEVFRAAYLAIAKGELEAAVSVGMNRALMFRRIIAPQVLRFALPGLGNLWQVALKDSSLISVTGLTELMRVSQVGAASTHRPFAFFLAGLVLYLIMTLASNRVFDAAEARATRGMRRVAG
jgi:octopine/nopaline transport system permease protein